MSLLSLMLTVLLQSTGVSAVADAIELRFEAKSAPTTQRVAPKPVPEPRLPADRACGKPPKPQTCAGAIGFCPEYRCVEGNWVDVRRRSKPGDPLR